MWAVSEVRDRAHRRKVGRRSRYDIMASCEMADEVRFVCSLVFVQHLRKKHKSSRSVSETRERVRFGFLGFVSVT